jgi:hypothetical protein
MNISTRHALHIDPCGDRCDEANTTSAADLCTACAARVLRLKTRPLVSPLNHLLSDTKRYVPSPEEEVQVRTVIQDVEQRTAEIDAASARIALLLEELSLERVRIQAYADQHRVMVAPVWNLPPEILSCIFILSLLRRLGYPEDITRSSIKSTLLLAGVNQHWRYVALTTPQLWTTLYIDEESCWEDCTYDLACMPSVFVKRSGDLPLSLYVRAKENPCRLNLITFVSALLPRWHRIILDIEVSTLLSLFNDTCPGDLRVLRTLDLRITSLWLEGAEVNPFTYFAKAPLLEHVSVTIPFCAGFSVLPWRQLKVWDSPVPLADFPLVFEWAPNLEHCFLQPTRLAFGQTLPPPDACAIGTAHKLTSLHISTGLVTNISVQLHHLPHFPALRRLFIYLDKRVLLPAAETALVPLFARSGARLEQVVLAVNVSHATLRMCLAHTPALVALHIHRIASDAILGFLAEAPGATEAFLLPRMTTLRLSGKIYFTAQAVIDVINARWANPAVEAEGWSPSSSEGSDDGLQIPTVPSYPRALKSVYILPPRHDKFDSRTRKELLSFKDKGFDVRISQFDRVEFIRHVV